MDDPRCGCGAKASCFGKYSGEDEEVHCCDECCDHDQVDGYCSPVVTKGTSWEDLRTQKFSKEEISKTADELKKDEA